MAPDTGERDRGLKRERYACFGVPEYWVVEGEARTVEIYRNGFADSGIPEVITGSWKWQPVPNGPVLEFSLPEVMKNHDSLKRMFKEQRKAADAERALA